MRLTARTYNILGVDTDSLIVNGGKLPEVALLMNKEDLKEIKEVINFFSKYSFEYTDELFEAVLVAHEQYEGEEMFSEFIKRSTEESISRRKSDEFPKYDYLCSEGELDLSEYMTDLAAKTLIKLRIETILLESKVDDLLEVKVNSIDNVELVFPEGNLIDDDAKNYLYEVLVELEIDIPYELKELISTDSELSEREEFEYELNELEESGDDDEFYSHISRGINEGIIDEEELFKIIKDKYLYPLISSNISYDFNLNSNVELRLLSKISKLLK